MPLLCVHLIISHVCSGCNCTCLKDATLCCVAEHFGDFICVFENPDELHNMTTCVQGDNVKLKMVGCDRSVLVCNAEKV